jgi:nitrate/nitrite transporter NarK
MCPTGHGGSAAPGTTLAAYGVARAATMPAGGLLCDRLGARRVLLLVDVLRAVLIGGLAISALTLASLRPTAVPPQEQHTAPKLRAVLAATLALPVMLVVVLAGNLASGGR